MTLTRNRAFIDIFKLRQGHAGLVGSKSIGQCPYKERKIRDTQIPREEGHVETGRD